MNKFSNKNIECKIRRQTNYNICKCKIVLEILEFLFNTETFKNSKCVHKILDNTDLNKDFKDEIKDLRIFINKLIDKNPNKLMFLDKDRLDKEFNNQRIALEKRTNYKNITNDLDLLKCICTCLSHISLTLSWLIRFENLKDCNDTFYNENYSPFTNYGNSISEYEEKIFNIFNMFSKKKRVLWTKNLKYKNKQIASNN